MSSYRYDALIFTLTDEIEHIETIIKELPDIHITIAAPVYFSDKILRLERYNNVQLETIFNDEQVSYLIDRSDLLLDINHGDELYKVCSRFISQKKTIISFENTSHAPESSILFNISHLEDFFDFLKNNQFRTSLNQYRKIWFDGDYNRQQFGQDSKIIVGNNVIGRSFTNFSISGTFYLAQNVFFNNYCSFNCLDRIEIGEDTMIGEGVKFYDHDHTFSREQIDKWNFKTAPIKIGKKCWIGSNVTILKGVTVGDNVVIGSGCLIRKDIPSNVIVYNNGEVIIKER